MIGNIDCTGLALDERDAMNRMIGRLQVQAEYDVNKYVPEYYNNMTEGNPFGKTKQRLNELGEFIVMHWNAVDFEFDANDAFRNVRYLMKPRESPLAFALADFSDDNIARMMETAVAWYLFDSIGRNSEHDDMLSEIATEANETLYMHMTADAWPIAKADEIHDECTVSFVGNAVRDLNDGYPVEFALQNAFTKYIDDMKAFVRECHVLRREYDLQSKRVAYDFRDAGTRKRSTV